MLPTHGTVTSVFLLANSLRHGPHSSILSWVNAAGKKSSFLAAAIDHRRVADFLVEARLVSVEAMVSPSHQLNAVSSQADRPTLVAIARLLFEIAPPAWLPLAVHETVRYEFIPSAELDSLDWLRPELEQLLLETAFELARSTETLKLGVGRAAELVVFAALAAAEAAPVHVSEISDQFGYDIETASGSPRRWEVKGCTTLTSSGFHLSRNEFDTCRRFGDQWRLIQVVFEPAALTAKQLTVLHVAAIRELPPVELTKIAPPDGGGFYWETSARMEPSAGAWTSSSLEFPADLILPSVSELGTLAVQLRSSNRGNCSL